MANLIEAIQSECNRLREQVLPEYEKLPNGVGMVAATFMKNSIRKAESRTRPNTTRDFAK